MSLTAEVAQNVRKGTLFFAGGEFTLQFDQQFMRTHRQEYLMFVELVKKLKQHKFDGRRNAWDMPLCEEAVRCLAQLVGYGITATTGAREKMGIELKKIAATDALKQQSTEVKVDLVIPGCEKLNEAMKNYQKAGVVFMSTVERSYLADDMGLGKSLQALAALEYKRAYPALIICPVKLKQNWLKECRIWLPHRNASMLVNDMAEITILGYSEIHNYVNYKLASGKKGERKSAEIEAKNKRFFFPDIRRMWSVVCDEGHWIKSSDSRRTQAATAIAKLSASTMRIVMSGTPIENGRPAELIAPLTFLDQMDTMGGWHTYVTRYCAGHRTQFGYNLSGASNVKELHDIISSKFYLRRLKTEVLKELPPKIQTIYDADMSNMAEYRRIEKDTMAYMMQMKGRLLTDGENNAAAMMKLGLLRQAAGLGKVEWIVEWINNFLESGQKFIIYATHRKVQEALVAGLAHWNPAVVLGGCEDVQIQQDKFMKTSCPLFIGSTLAAGFGLTLTAASHVGLAELMWTDSKHQQVFDRAHRIGQKDCVNCYYFLARETIDDDMWDVVSAKAQINASAVDGEDEAKASVLANLVRKLLNPKPELN